MAQGAYDYVYDTDFSTAAPQSPYDSPEQQAQKQKSPYVRPFKTSTQQEIDARSKRNIKINIFVIVLAVSLFSALGIVTANSFIKREDSFKAVATAKSNYELCLEENNIIKSDLNKFMAGVDIHKIARIDFGLQQVNSANEHVIGKEEMEEFIEEYFPDDKGELPKAAE